MNLKIVQMDTLLIQTMKINHYSSIFVEIKLKNIKIKVRRKSFAIIFRTNIL